MTHAHPIGTHVPDAGWLIALWLAVHGGDPAEGETIVAEETAREAALGIIAAVTPYIQAPSKVGASVTTLAKLGVTVAAHGGSVAPDQITSLRCYSTGYGHYCINNPPDPHDPPTAPHGPPREN